MMIEPADNFTFFLPPYIVFGRGKRNTIPQYSQKLGLHKVLVVVDPFFVETAFFMEITQALESQGIAVVPWSGVVPDPNDITVDEAVNVYRRENCDGVICIGGGSAMDTGKSVAVVIGSASQSIREHMAPAYSSIKGMAPVICIPTTSGTGAEVNPYAMVTNGETGEKGLGYPGWEMLRAQSLAIVDPDLTATMPPRLTAVTGVDALCQAVECYLTKTPNPISDCLALLSIQLIAQNLKCAVENGQDMNARANMSLAATLATMAFPNAGLNYPHFLSEPMADLYHLEHGVAVGSLLEATLIEMLAYKVDRLADVGEAFGVLNVGKSKLEIAEACIERVRQLLHDIRFPSLSEALSGKNTFQIDEFMMDVMRKKSHLLNTAEDQDRVRRIVERSLQS